MGAARIAYFFTITPPVSSVGTAVRTYSSYVCFMARGMRINCCMLSLFLGVFREFLGVFLREVCA